MSRSSVPSTILIISMFDLRKCQRSAKFHKNWNTLQFWGQICPISSQYRQFSNILFTINKLDLLWVPNFITLRIYFIFGTKFSWNEGLTLVLMICVLLGRKFDFLMVTWWLLLVTWWLLVVTACYRSLLLVPTFHMNIRCCLLNVRSDLLNNKMLCSWRCFDNTCSENFVIFAEKYPWWSLMLRKLQYVVLRHTYFLGIYKLFNINNSSNLDY